MSITYKGVLNGGANVDVKGDVTTTRKLLFYFNGGESAVEILKQSQIPKIGTVHPDNDTIYLSSISVSEPLQGDEIKSARYEVALNYARTKSNLENSNNQNVAPWKLPPYDISYAPVEYVVAFQKGYDYSKDLNGSPSIPVLNSAGDPFEESTTKKNTILRFTYNLEKFNPLWVGQYVDSINKNSISLLDISIPARKGKISTLAPSKQRQYDSNGTLQYVYWVIPVEIEISKEEWKKEIMQRGLFFKPLGSTEYKERIYKRVDGEAGANYGTKANTGTGSIPCDVPQRLTATGDLLDPTGASTSVTSIYASFNDKYQMDWKTLGFPKTASTSTALAILSGGSGI